MARSAAEKAATAKTKMPDFDEGNSSLTMQYYVNGTFSDTSPKPKHNTNTSPQIVPEHEPQESTGKYPCVPSRF
jgi:hypothetical protein